MTKIKITTVQSIDEDGGTLRLCIYLLVTVYIDKATLKTGNIY